MKNIPLSRFESSLKLGCWSPALWPWSLWFFSLSLGGRFHFRYCSLFFLVLRFLSLRSFCLFLCFLLFLGLIFNRQFFLDFLVFSFQIGIRHMAIFTFHVFFFRWTSLRFSCFFRSPWPPSPFSSPPSSWTASAPGRSSRCIGRQWTLCWNKGFRSLAKLLLGLRCGLLGCAKFTLHKKNHDRSWPFLGFPPCFMCLLLACIRFETL